MALLWEASLPFAVCCSCTLCEGEEGNLNALSGRFGGWLASQRNHGVQYGYIFTIISCRGGNGLWI
jgi:hypothetical protein